jgi:hypothetical protein
MNKLVLGAALAALACGPAAATPFLFSTGDPDGLMATASRPGSGSPFEIESADDFILADPTRITGATFTGLAPANASIDQVVLEIYRIFPLDSDTARTPNVPTRTNSPSDDALASRDSGTGDLSFSATVLQPTFTAGNSVQPGGIHPSPNQTTGGGGPVTGEELEIAVTLANPFVLPAGHYFFVPQVLLSGGDFLWLSAPKPIAPPGTPFVPDLQSWTRDEALAPDWLRVGTDIVGGSPAPTFNAAFALTGATVPEPGTLVLLGAAVAGLIALRRRA